MFICVFLNLFLLCISFLWVFLPLVFSYCTRIKRNPQFSILIVGPKKKQYFFEVSLVFHCSLSCSVLQLCPKQSHTFMTVWRSLSLRFSDTSALRSCLAPFIRCTFSAKLPGIPIRSVWGEALRPEHLTSIQVISRWRFM